MTFSSLVFTPFLNKIILEILAKRLGNIFPKIISLNQASFVKERVISNKIIMVQELFHDLDNMIRGGNVILKLDMSKAYDNIN